LARKKVVHQKSGSFDMGAARNGPGRFGKLGLRFPLGGKPGVELLPAGKTLF
jgi:hypothetical protein